MKRYLCLLALVTFVPLAAVAAQDVDRPSLSGLYYRGIRPDIILLRLNPDGTFLVRSIATPKTDLFDETGKWIGSSAGYNTGIHGMISASVESPTGVAYGLWELVGENVVFTPQSERGKLKDFLKQAAVLTRAGRKMLFRSEDKGREKLAMLYFYRQGDLPDHFPELTPGEIH